MKAARKVMAVLVVGLAFSLVASGSWSIDEDGAPVKFDRNRSPEIENPPGPGPPVEPPVQPSGLDGMQLVDGNAVPADVHRVRP